MKEQIIETALRLFLSNGVLQTSLIDIAKELNITKGAIYHYFRNKEELLNDSFNLVIQGMADYISPLENEEITLGDVLEFVQIIIRSQAEIDSSGQYEFILYCSRKHPELKKNLIDMYNRFNDAIRKKILQEIEQGKIQKNINLNLIMLKIGLAFEGTMFLNHVYTPVDLETYVPLLFNDIIDELYKK